MNWNNKLTTKLMLSATLLASMLTGPAIASGRCIPMAGTIINNAVGSGTLGVARFALGAQTFLCAIQGVAKPYDPNEDIGPLNFDHTIVCDDDNGAGPQPVHSQLRWDTSGFPTMQHGDCGNGFTSFSFHEQSRPVVGSGRFAGVKGGSIAIDGRIFCSGALKMKFVGVMCF
jgi:hypothetical protein